MPKTSKYIEDDDNEQEFVPNKEVEEEEDFVEQDTVKSKKRKLEPETTKEFVRDDEGNPIFPLSNKRRITVRKFSSGDAAVDIREVYLDKATQKMRPGKGICLPLNQFLKLKELLPEIDNAIDAITKK